MLHTTCRRRLAADPRDPSLDSHLVRCADCSAHAERLRAIVDAARDAAPNVPPGLTDHIIAAVGSAAEAPTPLPLHPTRPRTWTPLRAAAAVAAAVALTASAALALRGDTPAEVTTAAPEVALAAATQSLEATTFRFTVHGTVSTRIDVSALPGVDELLPENFGGFDDRLTASEDALDRLPGEAREQLREAWGSLEDLLQDRPFGDRATWPFGDEPIRQTVTFDAEGAVDRPGNARLSGTLALTGDLDADRVHDLEVIVLDGTTYVHDGDRWIRLRSGNSPLPVPMVDPAAPLDALSHLVGPIEDLGTEALDGETVRHLRAEVPMLGSDAFAGPLVDPAGDFTIDVWIGQDDRIRQLQVVSGDLRREGPPISIEMELTVRISDIGEPVEIDAPPADQVRDGDFPFGFGFRFELDAD